MDLNTQFNITINEHEVIISGRALIVDDALLVPYNKNKCTLKDICYIIKDGISRYNDRYGRYSSIKFDPEAIMIYPCNGGAMNLKVYVKVYGNAWH